MNTVEFELLVDTAADVVGARVMHVPEGTSVVQVVTAVEEMLLRDPAVESVLVMASGRAVVLTSRSLLERRFGLGSVTRRIGDGDGATLPGASTRFRLLRYRCAEPGCGGVGYGAYHDERERPPCRRCGRPMDLVDQ
jgi:hypothetical protein